MWTDFLFMFSFLTSCILTRCANLSFSYFSVPQLSLFFLSWLQMLSVFQCQGPREMTVNWGNAFFVSDPHQNGNISTPPSNTGGELQFDYILNRYYTIYVTTLLLKSHKFDKCIFVFCDRENCSTHKNRGIVNTSNSRGQYKTNSKGDKNTQ